MGDRTDVSGVGEKEASYAGTACISADNASGRLQKRWGLKNIVNMVASSFYKNQP